MLSESPGELAEDGGHYHLNASSPAEVRFSKQLVGLFAAMAATGA